MTTIIYKPELFAACDSKWSIDGREIRGITENKYVFFPSHSDGEMHVSFMCGTHIAIAVHQALYLQVINAEEYFGLISRYTDVFEMEFESVILTLEKGQLRSRNVHSYYPLSKKNGVYHLGTGGAHASGFYYHAPRWLRAKQRKKPPANLLNKCPIAGSVLSAYSQDNASGGKVNKIEWKDDSIAFSNILPIHQTYHETYSRTLESTIRGIHEMYENQKVMNKSVSASAAKSSTQNTNASRIKADTASSQATKVTLSRALEQIKLMQSL
ncbi:hypothetical protein [Kosakonia pseudosacchari]|uniref:hypothetical protein n=1 Tax=Kosakonia pseudosacchari TaxID=1646340 RepID=UPI003D978D01